MCRETTSRSPRDTDRCEAGVNAARERAEGRIFARQWAGRFARIGLSEVARDGRTPAERSHLRTLKAHGPDKRRVIIAASATHIAERTLSRSSPDDHVPNRDPQAAAESTIRRRDERDESRRHSRGDDSACRRSRTWTASVIRVAVVHPSACAAPTVVRGRIRRRHKALEVVALRSRRTRTPKGWHDVTTETHSGETLTLATEGWAWSADNRLAHARLARRKAHAHDQVSDLPQPAADVRTTWRRRGRRRFGITALANCVKDRQCLTPPLPTCRSGA